ncbi:MAG: dihydroorotate dehydrogenase catalytic subunit, partial [Lactobacillus iners]|nr:dihydroorotate dehydrogenase catalytic subunit [Lactobacillus iners]
HQAVKLPIIGMGGIETAADIVEFMLAGASAVAVGTAHFKDGLAIPHLVADLETLLNELKVDDINELIGQYKF